MSITIGTIILSCFLMLSPNVVTVQETLTFEHALEIALEQNFQIELARNTAVIAENNAHIGNADLLPRIDIVANARTQNIRLEGNDNTTTTTSAQIQASYTLFDGFGNIYRFKRLQGLDRLSKVEARFQIENMLYAVGQAYYIAAAAYENLKIANELLNISMQRLERVKKRAAFGQANTVDVLAAQVDYNNDTVTLARTELNWEESQRNLNTLLNRDISLDFAIVPEVRFVELQTMDDMKITAFERNASYQAALLDVDQAGIDLKIARAAYLPRLDLSASYGDDQIWQVSAVLNFNLFNGFQKNIDRKNAEIYLKNQQLREQQERLELEKEVSNAYRVYEYSRMVLDLEQKNLEAAEINFRRTEELFNLGQVTSTQFREAQLNLIRAKSNIATSMYTAKLNEIDLLRLTGRLVNEPAQ